MTVQLLDIIQLNPRVQSWHMWVISLWKASAKRVNSFPLCRQPRSHGILVHVYMRQALWWITHNFKNNNPSQPFHLSQLSVHCRQWFACQSAYFRSQLRFISAPNGEYQSTLQKIKPNLGREIMANKRQSIIEVWNIVIYVKAYVKHNQKEWKIILHYVKLMPNPFQTRFLKSGPI